MRCRAADGRCDNCPGAPLCWRRKGGAERNALGRSRGGFSTKINARTNAEGLPIGVVITPGQAHDVTAFPALMQEVDCDPEQLLGDKGYDSDAVRQEIEDHGGEALIPTKANRKLQRPVDKAIYGLRNRIERFFNRLIGASQLATTNSSRASQPSSSLQPSGSGLGLSTRPSALGNVRTKSLRAFSAEEMMTIVNKMI